MKKSIISLLFLLYGISICSQIESEKWNYLQMKELQKKGKLVELPYSEKLRICQIPDSLLFHLNTSDLLAICLSYPLNEDMLLFNNVNAGFNHVITNFNGWKEFLNRKDAANELSKKYSQDFDIDKIELISDLQNRNNFRYLLFFLEKIVEQTDLFANSPVNEKKTVLSALYNSYKKKLDHSDIYYGYAFHSNILAMQKILNIEKHNFMNDQKEYNLYNTNGRTDNLALIDQVIKETQNFIGK